MLLYKYFRPYQRQNDNWKVAEDLLKHLLIRFTPPTEFDDPFDCLPQIEGLENPEFFRRLFKESAANFKESRHFDKLPLAEKIFQEGRLSELEERKVHLDILNSEKWEIAYLDSLRKRAHSQVGILCLTERPDDILMWSHYAEHHTGFVVGFDTEKTNFFKHQIHEPGEIGELRKVNYSNKRPVAQVPYTEESPDADIFFTKNEDWQYQEEWRIVRFLKDADSQPKPGIHLFSIPPNCIQEIIFGSNAEKTKEPSIEPTLQLIKNNPAFGEVKIKKAHLSRKNYLLDISDFTG